MGQLVFQATLGGQVNLVGPNTASTFNLNVPAVSSTLATLAAQTFTGTQTMTTLTSPAATALTLQSAGTTALTIDTSQRVGVGTTSPNYPLDVRSANPSLNVQATTGTNQTSLLLQNTGGSFYFAIDNSAGTSYGTGTAYARALWSDGAYPITFTTNSSERMRIDSSGKVGIGTSSPNRLLSLYATQPVFQITNVASGNSQGTIQYQVSGSTDFVLDNQGSGSGGVISFSQAGSERMRIDSSGNLLVGRTNALSGYANGICQVNQTASNQGFVLTNTNATPYGAYYFYTSASPNSTGSEFLYCADSTALRMSVRSNGGIANYTANNVILSDRREKTNFSPATSYLDKICAIPVQTFNYIDQNLEEDGGLTLGVVAQDVQAIAPELVTEGNWGSKEEPKMRLEIYQTDLQYALMKSIQELKAINDTQAETLTQQTEAINALTARVVALEAK